MLNRRDIMKTGAALAAATTLPVVAGASAPTERTLRLWVLFKDGRLRSFPAFPQGESYMAVYEYQDKVICLKWAMEAINGRYICVSKPERHNHQPMTHGDMMMVRAK